MDRSQAEQLIRNSELALHSEILLANLMPSARIALLDDPKEDMQNPLSSYFGGDPCLPKGLDWPVWDKRDYLNGQIARLEDSFRANPRASGLLEIAEKMKQEVSRGPVPLPYLGQVSLNELSLAAPLSGWPREGRLLFFVDPTTWGFDPMARGYCRVMYLPSTASTAPVAWPSSFPAGTRLPARSFGFFREWTLPSSIECEAADLSNYGDDGSYRELSEKLMSTSGENECIHRCGGHPQEIQGDMRLECQLVANGIYCGDSAGYMDPRRQLLEQGKNDWQLLIQIDSDAKRIGWMWGDFGRIYFWAKRQDIELRSFDNAWCVLQCY